VARQTASWLARKVEWPKVRWSREVRSGIALVRRELVSHGWRSFRGLGGLQGSPPGMILAASPFVCVSWRGVDRLNCLKTKGLLLRSCQQTGYEVQKAAGIGVRRQALQPFRSQPYYFNASTLTITQLACVMGELGV